LTTDGRLHRHHLRLQSPRKARKEAKRKEAKKR
jgi:hypothetical protein